MNIPGGTEAQDSCLHLSDWRAANSSENVIQTECSCVWFAIFFQVIAVVFLESKYIRLRYFYAILPPAYIKLFRLS